MFPTFIPVPPRDSSPLKLRLHHFIGRAGQTTVRTRSKCPAHRKPEDPKRIVEIQTRRTIPENVELGQNLIPVHRGKIVPQSNEVRVVEIKKVTGRNDLLAEPIRVYRVIDAERRIDNGKLHDKFDPRGSPQLEVGAGHQAQLAVNLRAGKLRPQILQAGGVEFQTAAPDNAVGAHIAKQRHADGAHDFDAVLDVADALQIAARKCRLENQYRQRKRPKLRIAETVQTRRIEECERADALLGDKGDRSDGANVEPANGIFTARIEAARRDQVSPAVACGESRLNAQAQNIAFLIDRMEILGLEDVSDGIDVAAERPALKTHRIKETLPAGGVNRVVDRIVGDRRGQAAGDNAGQSRRAGNVAELDKAKQRRGRRTERGDVALAQSVGETDAREGKTAQRVAREHGEALAVLVVVLRDVGIYIDLLAEQNRSFAALVEIELAVEKTEAGGDGAVKQVRLGEAEQEVALAIAEFRGEGERFSDAQEIVGLVV